jgi:urease accessory protein
MKRSTQALLAVAGTVVPAAAALAHPGSGVHADMAVGLLHPVTGLDHLAALLAVGAWTATQPGSVRWTAPGVFLVAMATAALLAPGSSVPAGVEQAIAGSVLVLGLLVAGRWRLPATAALALCSGFAVFHGLAHGAEIATGVARLPYFAGFLAASALLLAAGHQAGRVLAGSAWLRGAGALLAAAGLAFLA